MVLPMIVGTKQILFLCTGNYYRSRYAEELFNHAARRDGLVWTAYSRGLAETGSPDNVGPISRFALEALLAKGIVPADRNPQPCSSADFAAAEIVIALQEAEHRPMVARRFPDMVDRVGYWHVPDVGFALPSIALATIDEHVRELTARLRS
jgi:protein-tyrosine phosphatase